jgi:hypothetical protein
MLNEMSHGGELVNIKVLSKAHNEQIRAIVDDDERFREFQAKMRDESLYTNVAVAMALHKSTCEVILSEQPTLDSNPSTSTVDNGNKTGFFLSKAFEPLRRFSRCLSLGNSMVGTVTQASGFFHRRCSEDFTSTRNGSDNSAKTRASKQQRKLPTATSSLRNLQRRTEPCNRNNSWSNLGNGYNDVPKEANRKCDRCNIPRDMNLNDIKHMSLQDLRMLYGNKCRRGTYTPVAHFNKGRQGLLKRRHNADAAQRNASYKNGDDLLKKHSARSVMDDEAYTSQKNTLWTEDTVQYLFEETVCGHKVHFWSAETYSALKHSDYEIQIKDIGNFDGYCYRECLPS